jgi:hypothetical protein
MKAGCPSNLRNLGEGCNVAWAKRPALLLESRAKRDALAAQLRQVVHSALQSSCRPRDRIFSKVFDMYLARVKQR